MDVAKKMLWSTKVDLLLPEAGGSGHPVFYITPQEAPGCPPRMVDALDLLDRALLLPSPAPRRWLDEYLRDYCTHFDNMQAIVNKYHGDRTCAVQSDEWKMLDNSPLSTGSRANMFRCIVDIVEAFVHVDSTRKRLDLVNASDDDLHGAIRNTPLALNMQVSLPDGSVRKLTVPLGTFSAFEPQEFAYWDDYGWTVFSEHLPGAQLRCAEISMTFDNGRDSCVIVAGVYNNRVSRAVRELDIECATRHYIVENEGDTVRVVREFYNGDSLVAREVVSSGTVQAIADKVRDSVTQCEGRDVVMRERLAQAVNQIPSEYAGVLGNVV